jgi:hypothetical protein
MATPYEKIYENLLPKFRSYEIPLMSTEEVKDYLHDFLIPAVSRFHVCRKDLNNRDDIIQRFNDDLSDIEIEILSNYLLIEYIDSTYIRVPTLLKVSLPSSDFKVFSPANFLDKLMAMHRTYVTENETLLSRYAWMGAKESGVKLGTGYKKNKNF